MTREVIMIRHGALEEQYRNRYIGSTDVPLSEEGIRQSVRLGEFLRDEGDFACWCSPKRRATQTAQTALPHLEEGLKIDQDLRELDFGQWEGLTFDEIQAADPDLVAQWASFDRDFQFPGGESLRDFLKRIRQVMERAVICPSDRVVLFTHGGVIRALLCSFLGLPPDRYLTFEVQPASITKLELLDGRGTLATLNNQFHLDGHEKDHPGHGGKS